MPDDSSWRGLRVFTIGHSTRSLDELVALLTSFDVSMLADIRTIPRSRHNPQFNADALAQALPPRGVEYVHVAALGGLRHSHPGPHERRSRRRGHPWVGASEQAPHDALRKGSRTDMSAIRANEREAIHESVAIALADARPESQFG